MEVTEELRIGWACDHCRHRARTTVLASDDAQAVTDRVVEAHAIARPDCHADHGDTGLRMNATGRDIPTLWEM